MPNIYTFNPNEDQKDNFDKNNPNYQLASVAYVYTLVKKVLDILEDHINNYNTHSNDSIRENLEIDPYANVTICELPESKNIDSISAENIDTNSKHQFISDAQLSLLKDKPSMHEVQTLIMDLRNEFKSNVNNSYNRLANSPNIIKKLRDIASIIENNNNLDSIFTALSDKVNATDLEQHINSAYHLTNNDRKALNLLLKFINKGCADWNATEDDPNYIRNKPASLPANGGNADTVGGYKVDKLINHQLEKYVYGVEGNDYQSNMVDALFKKNEKVDGIISALSSSQMGSYAFKNGEYQFDNFSLDTYYPAERHITIKGANHDTIFNANSVLVNGRVTIEDLTFTNANVTIKSFCTFDNVRFKNCTVIIDSSTQTDIRNCIFDDCIVTFRGILSNTMITGCRFINSGYPMYVSSNNIITNNLYY